jgi:hypothetical protein
MWELNYLPKLFEIISLPNYEELALAIPSSFLRKWTFLVNPVVEL